MIKIVAIITGIAVLIGAVSLALFKMVMLVISLPYIYLLLAFVVFNKTLRLLIISIKNIKKLKILKEAINEK